MGQHACLRVSGLLLLGSFTGCASKIQITFIQNLSIGCLEDAKLFLESKASFFDISSVASFKLFLIA